MNSDRENQDQYDVIQAKEEFESMLDPRTEAMLRRIKELEAQVAQLEKYRLIYEESE